MLAVRDVTGLVQHPKFADVLIDYEITLRSTGIQVCTGRNRGGWSLTKPGRGRRCPVHNLRTCPLHNLRACPLHKPNL